MGLLRRGLRQLTQVLAELVGRNDLFEKPGERASTAPLPPQEPSPPPTQSRTTQPDSGARPAAGCTKADLAQAIQAHAAGSRPKVVNHWASWCAPCIDELPLLVALAERVGDRAEFLGLSWDLFDPRGDQDDIVEHVARFADGNGMTWPSLLVTAAPKDFFEALGLSSEKVPQTWVIGTDGAVLGQFPGVLTPQRCDEIAALIQGAERR
ncbi:MAG: TlpA family protein disulfide reductase [Oligoflexia bacterium]|nr:TlpA family protein disulfide reductase [Oligoflexia bacterium]